MKITILYDNDVIIKKIKSDWGFSALINDNILFDMGPHGKRLLNNMRKLNIDPEKIEIVIISHQHWDHFGGLFSFFSVNRNITIYLTKSLSRLYKRRIAEKGRIVEITEPTKITDNIFTTGELGQVIKEQSLILRGNKGITLITGCSHPGVNEILNKGKEFGKIYGIMGGFHNFNNFDILNDLELISPMHCTSNKEKFQELYPKSYVKGGVGKVFEV